MKILHPSGEYYDLPVDLALEFTRYNPFFNEHGELSQPIDLPLSPRNKRLLGYPNRPDRGYRPEDIDVCLDLGFVKMPARQVVHGAGVSCADTTFYLNDGGLYSRIQETTLKDVFSACVYDYGSAIKAVEFCESIISGFSDSIRDSRFAIFRTVVDGPSDGSYRILNELQTTGSGRKYKSRNVRKEVVDGKEVTYPAGYGITPFVRVGYVLTHIAEYFGYTLDADFLDASPFREMVLLNNNLDTLIDGKIHVSTILPDITVKELLNVFRARFCMEFYPDEVNHTLGVVFFRDLEHAKPVDLTDKVAGDPDVEFPEFRKIALISESVKDSETYQPLSELFEDHPGIFKHKKESNWQPPYSPGIAKPWYYHPVTGRVYQSAIRGNTEICVVRGSFTDSYESPVDLPSLEVQLPGKMPYPLADVTPGVITRTTDLYTGAPRCVKSVIVYSDNTEDSDSSTEELLPMLALEGTFNAGYVTDHPDLNFEGTAHSLMPNGEHGLYTQYYQYYAYLRQNSLIKVTFMMRLSDLEKISLSPLSKIRIRNQEYLIDSIRYAIGDRSLCEMSLYSLDPLAPEVPLQDFSLSEPPGYEWVAHWSYDLPGLGSANTPTIGSFTFVDWVSAVDTIYLEIATEADYNAYRDGSDNYWEQRTYTGRWYHTNSGANSEKITGTMTVGLQVKKA